MGIGQRQYGLKRAVSAFAGDRRGNVAMMWGLCAFVLIGMIGLAVDFTRAQTMRTRLQNAADGAALVAERSSNLPIAQRTEAARAFFDAEMGEFASNATFTVTQVASGGHRVDANIPMPVSLARIIKNEDWDVGVSSEAQAQASPPIEVALVLDNTGSMANDMQALRDAAEDLADFLLSIDGGTSTSTVDVALVPFVAQVNIGNGATQMAWMDTAGNNPHHGEFLEDRQLQTRNPRNNACTNAARFPTTVANAPTYSDGTPYRVRWVPRLPIIGPCVAYNPSRINIFDLYRTLPASVGGWSGCVEARPPPFDINDAAPDPGRPETMFVPYFNNDEGDDQTDSNNWLTDSSNLFNATNTGSIDNGDTGRTLNVFKYRSNASVSISNAQPNMRGPHRGCPRPIVPLTSNRNTVINAIRGMVHSNGGGTNQTEGLAWGWRVLSHTAPFTQGRDPNTQDVRKVIVLMTDGENTSIDNNNDAFESDYSSYQHRRLWREYQFNLLDFLGGVLGLTAIDDDWQRLNAGNAVINGRSAMETYINRRQETLCQSIKDEGIEIYTIQFRDSSSGNRTRLMNCASQPATGPNGHFFQAANAAQLQQAFNAIGSGIGQLRLTH